MSSATNTLIVLDDSNPSFKYGGALHWANITLPSSFDSYENQVSFDGDPLNFGNMTLTFNGTGASFFGVTPPSNYDQGMQVTIDNNTPYNTSFSAGNTPQRYGQFYQTPSLSDGEHTITFERLSFLSMDYAVVTAGQSNVLTNTRIIVDDEDATFSYKGSGWKKDIHTFPTFGGHPDGLPFGNSTHQTNTIGDSVTIAFPGEVISVYGALSYEQPGTLSASYSVDGGTPTIQNYTVDANAPELQNGGGIKQNILLFKQDRLRATIHTIAVTLVHTENMTFTLDYILYTPFFNTIASKPDLSHVLPPSSTGSSNPDPSNSANSTTTGSHKTPVGAIAGGVVGGVVLLALALIAFLFRRHKQRKPRELPVRQSLPEPDYFSPSIRDTPMVTQVEPLLHTHHTSDYVSSAPSSVRLKKSSDKRGLHLHVVDDSPAPPAYEEEASGSRQV